MKSVKIISLFFWVVFVIPAYGQQEIQPVKRLNISALVLHIEGTTLYVGGADRVRIFDITNGNDPRLQGELPVNGAVVGIATIGDIMVVGLEHQVDPNLWIVDISDKSTPTLLFQRRTDQERKIISVLRSVGRTLFIGLDDLAVQATELDENNDIKTILGTVPVPDVITDIRIKGNRMYVSTWSNIMVVDISDPANMIVVKEIFTDDANNGLSIEDNRMASAEGITGITLYDISNPDNPQKIQPDPNTFATIDTFVDNENWKVSLRQDFLYVSVLFAPSQNIFDPEDPGGLRIYDIQQQNNMRMILRNNVQFDGLDVMAYDGYVYVAEDASLGVFRHGPFGERPTATPVVPTKTPTPTHTFTPTNTPPLLVPPTNTPPGLPVTPTFTPTSTLPPLPTPTVTPIPVVPTNTPVQPVPTPTSPPTGTGGLPASLFTSDFDGPLLGNEQFAPQLPFVGTFTLAQSAIGALPTDGAFSGATNGRGLAITVNTGEAITLIGPFLSLDAGTPALLRVNVRSTGGGASVALAALDGSFDGSQATNIPANSQVFAGAYKRFSLVYKPPTNSIIPILQVSGGGGQTAPVTVYFDNLEVIPLPPGTLIPVEELGAGGMAP